VTTTVDESTRPATRRGPFVGLAPYSEEDADFFFGRERERRLIVANLRSARLTLLYGESGVGKSSILRAGVMHDLRTRTARRASRSAVGDEPPIAVTYFSEWRDDDVVERLMASIHTSVEDALGRDAQPAPRPGPDHVESLRRWKQSVRSILVILDQFEEYFLYHPVDSGPTSFSTFFPRIVNDAGLNVHFIVALREDAWARLDLFKSSIPSLFANYLRLGHLDEAAARRAIEGPIDVYNERTGSAFSIEPALVDAVLADVTAERQIPAANGERPPVAGSGARIETPFLQLVMERLWEAARDGDGRLRLATLQELGGPREIVRRHLTDALAGLDSRQRAIAAAAFRFLITSNNAKVAQRTSDLAAWTNLPEADIVDVLQRLATGSRGRVLRPLAPAPGDHSMRFELFHDVLAEPVVAWRKAYETASAAEAASARLREEEAMRRREEAAQHEARFNRLVKRAAIALAALAVALAAAVVVALRERSAAVEQRSVARSSQLAADSVARLADDPELSLLLAREAWSESHTPAAAAAMRVAVGSSLLRVRLRHGEPVLGTAASARGDVLVTWGEHRLRAWRRRDGRLLSSRALDGARAVALASDGRHVAVTDAQGGAVYPTRRGRRIVLAGARRADELPSVAFSGDGGLVAAGGTGGATVWRTASGVPIARLRMPLATAVAFDPEGRRVLAVAGGDGAVRLWRMGDRPVRVMRQPDGPSDVRDGASRTATLAFTRDGRRLAAALHGEDAIVWRTATGRTLRTFHAAGGPIQDLVWDAPGSTLLAATGKLVEGFPMRRRSPIFLTKHTAPVTAVRVSRSGAYIATASEDATGGVFDTSSLGELATLRPHGAAVTDLAFAGRRVVTASRDGFARIWEPTTSRVYFGHSKAVERATFTPDWRRIVSVASDGTALMFDSRRNTRVQLHTAGLRSVRSVELSAQGGGIVMAGAGRRAGEGLIVYGNLDSNARPVVTRLPDVGDVSLFRVAPSGRQIVMATAGTSSVATGLDEGPQAFLLKVARNERRLLQTHGQAIVGGEYSHDGKLFVAACADGVPRIYDAREGRLLRELARHGPQMLGAAFSPDDRRLLTYGGLGVVRIVSARTGRLITALRGHGSPVTSAAFSRDGRLVVASAEQTIRIWDASTGVRLAVLRPHAATVNSVEFSRDGRSVLSAGDDAKVKLTRCETCGPLSDVLELADRRVTRSLTPEERREFGVPSGDR
jgi:WD40 repeat protein